jgi:hypothetical protein
LRFYVHAPDGFDALLAERLENHFASFNLGRLYAAEAAEELLNIRYQLDMILQAAGPAEVQAHL